MGQDQTDRLASGFMIFTRPLPFGITETFVETVSEIQAPWLECQSADPIGITRTILIVTKPDY